MLGSVGEIGSNLGNINSEFHRLLRNNLGFPENQIIKVRDQLSFIGIYKSTNIVLKNNMSLTDRFSYVRVCLTGCSYRCGSCDKNDINICLTCADYTRVMSRSCNCVNGYFGTVRNSLCNQSN